MIFPQILVTYVHAEWGLDVFIYEGFMTPLLLLFSLIFWCLPRDSNIFFHIWNVSEYTI